MKRRLLIKTIYLLFVCLLVASMVFSSSSLTVNEDYYEGIYSFIDMMYRNELGIDNIMGASLNGVMDGLAPYSCFELSLKEYSGSFSGIGANLEKVRNGFIIVSVNPSSSAYKTGLVTGDVIYRIDKQNASAMGIESFMAYLHSRESVLIEVIDSDTGHISALRIDTEPYYSNDVDYVILDNAGYIRINAFSEATDDIVKGILGSVKALGMSEIILDLRDLASMNIKDSSAVAGLLSEGGTISRTRAGTYNVRKQEVDFNVSILVNSKTAGAGEIIASAVPSVIYGQATAGEAYYIKKYPVFTEEAYEYYSEETRIQGIVGILNHLKARSTEIPDSDISGYLNIVESGVFDSSGRLISADNRITPDVYVANTEIGYMDYTPGEGMIEIRRDYSEGSVNYDVFLAKKILLSIGVFNGTMNVVFDSDMARAVNAYKTSVGFTADGVLDMSTQAMLNTYSMKTAVLDDDCVQAALGDIH